MLFWSFWTSVQGALENFSCRRLLMLSPTGRAYITSHVMLHFEHFVIVKRNDPFLYWYTVTSAVRERVESCREPAGRSSAP
jgi:hypothetical protein